MNNKNRKNWDFYETTVRKKREGETSAHIPRQLVQNLMLEVDPEGIAARQVNKKIRKHKPSFTSEVPLWAVSLDGHDKLRGYQNSALPLGVMAAWILFLLRYLFFSSAS